MTKMINTLINGQWDIVLPEHRATRPEWKTEQGWERARLDHMYATTKPGDIVYYVGAEEGDMCGLLAMWGAELVMFEPNPKVWPNIGAIWEANKIQPPVLSFAAFAGNKTDGGIDFYYDGFPPEAEGPIISDHGFKNLCEADGTIPQVKIDDVVFTTIQQGIPQIPTMITLDVEGAEWEVLRGAEKTLREHLPRIYLSLHPEFMYEIYKEYAFDLRNWIKGIGYTETLLDYQHEVHLVYERTEA